MEGIGIGIGTGETTLGESTEPAPVCQSDSLIEPQQAGMVEF